MNIKSLFLAVVFLVSEYYVEADFYKHDNGWIYTGEEITRLVFVLREVKNEIPAGASRIQIETIFRDVFQRLYHDDNEQQGTAFA